MLRCQRSICVVLTSPQVEQSPLHYPISANPRGLSHTIIDILLSMFRA